MKMLDNDVHEDIKYVEGLVANNSQVIREIYRLHAKGISSLVRNNGGTSEDAKDVFQEGLMVIYQKAQTSDFRLTSSFFSFLYAICRRLWLKKMTKNTLKEVTFIEKSAYMDEKDIEKDIQERAKFSFYRKKFKLLGTECQQILNLFFDKVSMAEIKETMAYGSISYTKKKKFHCKERLFSLIREDSLYREYKL